MSEQSPSPSEPVPPHQPSSPRQPGSACHPPLIGLPRWHPHPTLASTLRTIHQDGWAVTSVADRCARPTSSCVGPSDAVSYTTGLTVHEIPELMIYGLDPSTAARALHGLGRLLHDHDWRPLAAGGETFFLGDLGRRVLLIEAVDKDDMAITNSLFPDAPALQAVWADSHGRFPWQLEYTEIETHQPLKGPLREQFPDPRRRHLSCVSDSGERLVARRQRRPSAS